MIEFEFKDEAEAGRFMDWCERHELVAQRAGDRVWVQDPDADLAEVAPSRFGPTTLMRAVGR